ncbi:hypothetical protein LEP1GSC062_0730 [Leptospira alexanderi serovar Manhao 3 str. L 60]|uniref:Uncharacterized protein n=1 Tax=Leptospira alexanderi serovar Manhao 3 str. L 60 TaxID=1049759 RepID=V6I1A2_9LEPT|nr:hypothetical protein LEP1GSC062_0730 [Leptospira alexanderi serovar Manhao 3 str. L 60]
MGSSFFVFLLGIVLKIHIVRFVSRLFLHKNDLQETKSSSFTRLKEVLF